MAEESALLPQNTYHVEEEPDTGVIPDTAYLLPFADVVEMYDWTSDVPFNARTGIGNIDKQKFDRGQEEHSFTVEHPLQGAIDEDDVGGGGDVNAVHVLEAIERLANRQLKRRTIIWKTEHPGDGIEGAGRHIYTVARHCAPDVLTLSGDPEDNSPVTVNLEYVSPKIRPYTLDQPDDPDTLDIASTESEDGDVIIEGLDDTDSPLEETVSLVDGEATTSGSFSEIYAVWAEDDFAGDLTVSTTTEENTLITLYGSESYWDIEGDKGIPVLPESGERVDEHGGVEQKFLSNTVDWNGGPIAPEYNSVELEVNNNHDPKNAAGKIGVEYVAGIRDVTLTATVAGEKQANEKVDVILRQLLGDLVWNLDLNTITVPNATVSDPGSKVFNAEEAFANVDVEFTGKGINVETV